MTLTRHRTIQYIGILCSLLLIAVGYWYFAVRAGVKTNSGATQQAGIDDPANGLAAYWKFDENTGTSTTDGSTNGATGTLTNGPTWVAGQIGYALDFDGTDDYVTAPDADALELDVERARFTISGWFNRDTFTTDDTIVAKRNGIAAGDGGYIVYIDDATDQLIFEFSDGVDEVSTASTTTFTATGWHHFVITQILDTGDGNPRVYIDGQLETASVTGNINDMEPVGNALAQRIGAESDGGNPFDGKIDEVRYYHTRAFTAEQVAALYRLTVPTGVDTGLKGYWSFDGQETGTYAYDQSGAGNEGTFTGGPTAIAGRVGQALNFDGSNDYVNMGSGASLDNIVNLTTCIWANPNGTTDGAMIAKDDSVTGWSIRNNSTSLNSLDFYRGWTGGAGYAQWRTASGTLPNDVWTHVCVTYVNTSTSNDPIIYVNGVSTPFTEVNAPSGTLIDESSFVTTIGAYGSTPTGFFGGKLDEGRIYNRILSAGEIKNLYNLSASDKTNTSDTQAQGGSSLSAGLALYWPLDDGSGTNADDKSANANDGTLTNSPTFTTGQIGGGVDFDGTDDYIAVADPASGVLDFAPPISAPAAGDIWSLSLWFNRDTATTDDTLIAKKNSQTTNTDDGYIVWIDDATDEINVRLDDNNDADESSTSSTTTYTTAGWHHLVVVLDGDHYGDYIGGFNCPLIFVDGVHVTDAATCANYLYYVDDTSNALAFTVGAESDGGNPFDGKVDDVRVYNRVITPADIEALYRATATTTGIDTGLRGYWTFDEPDMNETNGGVIYDRSGAGNWGELTNSPTKVRGRVGQALQFDGTDDYVTMGDVNALDGLTTTTWSAWFKTTATAEKHFIDKSFCGGTSADGPVDFGINFGGANGKVAVYLANGSTVSGVVGGGSAVNDGEWHMATFTYDGSTILIYVDGRLETTTAWAGGALSSTANAVQIGGDCNGHGGLYWNGGIDEARVYSRVLSATEIKSLYDRSAPDKVNTSISTPQGTGRLDSGLAGYWKLDENTGTSAADSSTNSNAGTLTNGPTWTTGRIGSAVSFDGTNDYITVADNSALDFGDTDNFTLSGWFNRSTFTTYDYVVEKLNGGAGYELTISDSLDALVFSASDGTDTYTIYSTTTFTSSGWHHFAITWDNQSEDNSRVYVDTVNETASRTGTFANIGNLSNAVAFQIGEQGGLGNPFGGQLDEIRVYNRALSQEEINNLYRLTTPTGTDTSLKGYWSFNGQDMAGTTAYDRSGVGNDGTLTNSPTRARGKLGQALSFDGSNDYIEMGDINTIDGLTAITASAWVKTTVTGEKHILDKSLCSGTTDTGTFELHQETVTNDIMRFRIYKSGGSPDSYVADSNRSINDGNWHLVTGTYDGSNVRIYIDGIVDGVTAAAGITLSSNAYTVQIGGNCNGSSFPWNGGIDEARIYSRALSASEIQALYNSGK